MKVLVTGGKGYVGSKLVKKLEEQGNEVDTFDAVDSEYLSNVRKNIVEDYDVVYHLAALAEISYTDKHPQETYDVNIDGLNKLCSACAEGKTRLIFTSTSCIYGEPLELPSKEDGLINPTDAYAMSKAAENIL